MNLRVETQSQVLVSILIAIFLITLVPNFTGYATLTVQRGEVRIDEISLSSNHEKLLPGDILTATIEIINTGDQSVEDLVLEVYIDDLTDEDVLGDKEEIDDIKLGEEGDGEDDEYKPTFYFKIPHDADEDNKYVLRIKVYKDGDEGSYYAEKTEEIDIERRLHHFVVDDVVLTPETLKCGERLKITTDVRNTGTSTDPEEGLILSISNKPLEIEAFQGPFTLEEDELKRDIQLVTIPENIKGGKYILSLLVYNVNYETRLQKEFIITECVLGVAPLETTSSYFEIIKAARPIFIAIDKPLTATKRLRIETSSEIRDATIAVSALSQMPTNIPVPEGRSFRFLSVDHTLGDKLRSAVIEFEVSKTWIDTNKINESSIILQNYNYRTWTEIPAQKMSETDTTIRYTATAKELNILAITGESLEVEVPEEVPEVVSVCGNGICESEETEENCSQDCKPRRAWFVNPIIWISIGIGLIVFLVGLKLMAPAIEIPRSEYKRVSRYIGHRLKQGYHPQKIKQELHQAGWHPHSIESIFRRKRIK